MKKEYETVWEIFNECANNQMRDVFFDEIETDDPEAYIRQKFPDKNLKYEKTVEADGTECRAGGRLRGIFSFRGKRISPFDPQEKGFDWQSGARTTFMPPE